MAWTRGNLVTSGKTKEIFKTNEDPGMGIFKAGNNISAHDDPAYTKQFEAKPRLATQTTCNVFRLLKSCGVTVAFEERISDDEFVAPIVNMIPLEIISRRVADGSYLKRMPQFKREGGRLHQFHRLVTEFFLKTSGGRLVLDGKVLVDNLPQIPAQKEGETKPMDDPFITNPQEIDLWNLADPKKPIWEKGALLEHTVKPSEIFSQEIINPATGEIWTIPEIMAHLDMLTRSAFLIMEKAWGMLGFKLGDWKIECGFTADGRIVIADVIDNDSWRLRDKENREKSKQVFRDHGLTKEVEINYAQISELSDRFQLPKQALVIWKGSDKDASPEIPVIPGVEVVEVILSGHKKSYAALARLEEIIRDYPDGGVIIVVVGRSNGLGPTLAAHTSWPVLSVAATADKHPEDVWSSLRLPSKNPMATILELQNGVDFALNILGVKNPAVYMCRQNDIEQLDAGY